MTTDHDALLIVSFGGPEELDQVWDFLNQIAAGRNIPPERLQEVYERYASVGGKSPANENNRKLKADLQQIFEEAGLNIKVYLGNRNSPPFLYDALNEMQTDKRTNGLAFITSPFASYSSCRQYLENIQTAQKDLSTATNQPAPKIERLRLFYNHPTFIQIHFENIQQALKMLDGYESPTILFTAHSLPIQMAEKCDYASQILETCELIIKMLPKEHSLDWRLVYQSISGPPQNWLGPNILDEIDKLKAKGADAVLVSPVGFLSDHMEVVFDLDTDAKSHAEKLGLGWSRAATPQDSINFAPMVLDLLLSEPTPDICSPDCCI